MFGYVFQRIYYELRPINKLCGNGVNDVWPMARREPKLRCMLPSAGWLLAFLPFVVDYSFRVLRSRGFCRGRLLPLDFARESVPVY